MSVFSNIGINPETGLLVTGIAFNPAFSTTKNTEDPKTKKLQSSLLEYVQPQTQFLPTVSIAPATRFDLTDSLVTKREICTGDGGNTCYNNNRRCYLPGPVKISNAVRTTDWPILNSIAEICQKSDIYVCGNTPCVQHREHLERVVPKCAWPEFRRWLIQLVACQKTLLCSEDPPNSLLHLASAVNSFFWVFDVMNRSSNFSSRMTDKYVTKSGALASVDIWSVSELIFWGICVQEAFELKTMIFEGWGKNMIPHKIAGRPIMKAIQNATDGDKVICPNRLWNLSFISERAEHDIPCIMDLASQHPNLRHEGHRSCTTGLCSYGHLNSTVVKQLHLCENPSACERERLYFDPKLLEESLDRHGGTAWSLTEPYEVSDKPYVAISHPWSDGTGIGLAKPGLVNRCLFNYFADIVKSLGCEAIWWDTISIPTEPRSRAIAINKMHNNYSKAKYKLLYDRQLAQFEWAEDGSPCLAIVLSTWFTRGWTAVECAMAEKIKVVFKKPGANEPIIKDLDDDVLSKDPTSCHPAHWIASQMIRRVRKGAEIDNVGDLLAILKPRHTSWPRDRMIIAGLLVGIHVDYDMSPESITKAIFKKVGKVTLQGLLHGQTTMTESAGWSWCPNYLYDLPAAPPKQVDTWSSKSLFIDKDGTVGGWVIARLVQREDVWDRRIIPLSSQPSVLFKVNTALEKWNDCFLLGTYPGPYMLVLIEERMPDDRLRLFNKFVGFKYIAAVHFADSHDFVKTTQHGGLTKFISVMIGRDPRNYPALQDPNDNHEEGGPGCFGARCIHQEFKYRFLGQYIWVGDYFPKGQLLVPRYRDFGMPGHGLSEPGVSMHALKVQQNPVDENHTIEVTLEENPLLFISHIGIVTDLSGRWFGDTPLFTRVVPTPSWPPQYVPACFRAKSYGSVHLPVKLSNELFKLQSSTAIVTYAGLDPNFLQPSDELPYKGIWARFYGNKEYDLELFRQDKKGEIISVKLTSARDEQPRAVLVVHIPDTAAQTIVDGRLGVGTHDSDDEFPKSWKAAKFGFLHKDAIDVDILETGFERIRYRRVSNNLLILQ